MVTSVHFNSSRFFAISHFLEGVSKMRGRDLFFFVSFFFTESCFRVRPLQVTLLGDSVRNLYSAGGPSAGRAIFTYRHINNLFMHSGQCLFNSSFHNYNTRSKHKLLQGGDIGLYILLSCVTVHFVL